MASLGPGQRQPISSPLVGYPVIVEHLLHGLNGFPSPLYRVVKNNTVKPLDDLWTTGSDAQEKPAIRSASTAKVAKSF